VVVDIPAAHWHHELMAGRTEDPRQAGRQGQGAKASPARAGKAEIKWGVGDDPNALLGDVMDDFQKAAEEEAARRAAVARAKEEEAERHRREEEERRQAEVRRRLQEEEERRRRQEQERQEQVRRAQLADQPPPPAAASGDGADEERQPTLPPDQGSEGSHRPGLGFAPVPQPSPSQELLRPLGPTALEKSLRQQLDATRKQTLIAVVGGALFLILSLVLLLLWIGKGDELEGVRSELAAAHAQQEATAGKLAEVEAKVATLEKQKAALDAQTRKLETQAAQLEEQLQAARVAADAPRATSGRGGRRPGGNGGGAKKPPEDRPIDIKIDQGGLVF